MRLFEQKPAQMREQTPLSSRSGFSNAAADRHPQAAQDHAASTQQQRADSSQPPAYDLSRISVYPPPRSSAPMEANAHAEGNSGPATHTMSAGGCTCGSCAKCRGKGLLDSSATPRHSHNDQEGQRASPKRPATISGGVGSNATVGPFGDYPVLNKQVIVSHVERPRFNSCHQQPQFEWTVSFAPASQQGWLVQRVESSYEARNCDGTAGKCDGTPNVPADPNFVPAPVYWEAWQIVPGGGIQPDFDGRHDTWRRTFEVPTCGSWSIEGTLYVTNALPVKDFIAPNPAVPWAVDVPSTLNDPTRAVLGSPIGRRRISGAWNCCDPDPKKHVHQPKT
jgi:hypothetical protein